MTIDQIIIELRKGKTIRANGKPEQLFQRVQTASPVRKVRKSTVTKSGHITPVNTNKPIKRHSLAPIMTPSVTLSPFRVANKSATKKITSPRVTRTSMPIGIYTKSKTTG